jgi:hypothetical protein
MSHVLPAFGDCTCGKAWMMVGPIPPCPTHGTPWGQLQAPPAPAGVPVPAWTDEDRKLLREAIQRIAALEAADRTGPVDPEPIKAGGTD